MRPSLRLLSVLSAASGCAVALGSALALNGGDNPIPGASIESAPPVDADPTAPAFPVDVRRFDMICDVHSESSGAPPPDGNRGSPYATFEPWDGTIRQSVDLEIMRVCTPFCSYNRPSWVESADAERIVFRRGMHSQGWLRRIDGVYYHRNDNDGHIIEETGTCRRADFTPFPRNERPRRIQIAPGEPESGPEAEFWSEYLENRDWDDPLFPVHARRFDVECDPNLRDPPRESERARLRDALTDERWPDYRRLAINLEAMRACRFPCPNGFDLNVADATDEHITLDEAPGITTRLYRTGRTTTRREIGGRNAEAVLACFPRPFTTKLLDLPPREQASGNGAGEG